MIESGISGRGTKSLIADQLTGINEEPFDCSHRSKQRKGICARLASARSMLDRQAPRRARGG
jgi:hypothetical protein